jgi:hypothetical protein
MRGLPAYARVRRTLAPGVHRLVDLLPHLRRSPALRRIVATDAARRRLLAHTRVLICGRRGYAFVEVEGPWIVLSEHYYATGGDLDLYLDLLHELTHLRQLGEGFDLWDERFDYVERPTEVEAFAVAVAEGRRLGMSRADVLEHLKNPWMTRRETLRLLGHIDRFLDGGPLPNRAAALHGAPFRVHHPWRCAASALDKTSR